MPVVDSVEHPTTRKIWRNSGRFHDEFTEQEQYRLHTSIVPGIVIARNQLAVWPGEVWSDDQRIIAGLDAMVSALIITEARKQEILTL